MTRKCVLCKETNYKNHYSFFSAPKDPEIRKKWQIALGIENYTITDDIYVCSRHFHKNDIITHWVSGVPPQVIKIKYKKCRLRPGAVPGKHFYSCNTSQPIDKDILNKNKMDMNDLFIFRRKERVDSLKNEKTFLISRKKKNFNDDEHTDNKNANVCYQMYSKLQDYTSNIDEDFECSNIHLSEDVDKIDINVSTQNLESREPISKRNESNKKLGYNNSYSLNVFVEPNTESVNTRRDSQILNKQSHADTLNKTVESVKKHDFFKKNNMSLEIWKHNIISTDSEESINNNLKITNDLYMNNQILTTLHYNNLSTQNKIVNDVSKNEILFEDFLEVCTEVSVPRGWSCLVTSKGHSTTVVYLCMGITKDGLPFVEKQVFVRSDMILHCAVANREIDPFVHNLTKEDKHIKVKSLLDIEKLVNEFNRRVVCQGIRDGKRYKDSDMMKVTYKDGIKWRHILCPLIVNNNLPRCTKCAVLFRTLIRKSSHTYKTEVKKYVHHNKSKNV